MFEQLTFSWNDFKFRVV